MASRVLYISPRFRALSIIIFASLFAAALISVPNVVFLKNAFADPIYTLNNQTSCLALPLTGSSPTWDATGQTCTIPMNAKLAWTDGTDLIIIHGVTLNILGQYIASSVTNHGVMVVVGELGYSGIINEQDGVINNHSVKFHLSYNDLFFNRGIFVNDADIPSWSGGIQNEGTGTVNNYGTLSFDSDDSEPKNYGIYNNYETIQLINDAQFFNENTGVLNNYKDALLDIQLNSELRNDGVVNNRIDGIIVNNGSHILNRVELNNYGSIENYYIPLYDYDATISNQPSAHIYNCETGSVTGTYVLFGHPPEDICNPNPPEFAEIVDFNGDGFADLAIGVPDEGLNHNQITKAGAISVIYGTSDGLSPDPTGGAAPENQVLNQNTAGVMGVASNTEDFGYSLATADFNGDRFTDLAIGQPSATSVGGEVNIMYGSPSGLSLTDVPNQIFSQSSPSVDGTGASDEQFGKALSTGDFNGDGYDDLAIGNPAKDIPTKTFGLQVDAGSAHVIYGSSEGLSATAVGDGTGLDDQVWTMNKVFGGGSNTGDQFGYALTSGDFNGDGIDDLAIGMPFDDYAVMTTDVRVNGGAVEIIYGSDNGLINVPEQNEYIFGGINTIKAGGQNDEHFGSALASADFDNDGFDDLAIGVPDESFDGLLPNTGAVGIIFGSDEGLWWSFVSDELWYQGTEGVEGNPEANENFGTSIIAGDFNGDGRADLAVGVPNDKVSNGVSGGSVNVIYGASSGLTVIGVPDAIINQNSPQIIEVSDADDKFGSALASGDYNGDGYEDLAVGIPREDINKNLIADGGAVSVIYGSVGGLSATAATDGTGRINELWTQNSDLVKDSSEAGDLFGWALG